MKICALLPVGALLVASMLGCIVRAAEPDLTVTPLARDGQVLVSFELSDGFTSEMREAIQSGLPTTFSYQVELRRATPVFDRTVASITITASVHFDNLTRRYQMSKSVDGRVEDAQPTEDLEAVRRWMTVFKSVPLSRTTALEPNAEYYVRVRAHTRPKTTWSIWPWDARAILGLAKFTFIP